MEILQFQDTLIMLGILAVIVTAIIFFIISMQNTLKLVEPQNRAMQPGNVWLLLIPIFGFIWSFVIVNAINKSCKAQLAQYGVFYDQQSTFRLGMGWAFCQVLGVIIGYFSIVSIIMFFVYWIKVNEIRKQLQELKQLYQNKDESSIL